MATEKQKKLGRLVSHVWFDPRGCWIYNGRRDSYGFFEGELAHRASWALHHGPIEPGLHILHGCDVKGCINPAHLRPGTPRENNADRKRAAARARGEPATPIPHRTRQFNFRMSYEHHSILSAAATEARLSLAAWLTVGGLHMAGRSDLAEQLTNVLSIRWDKNAEDA